ncbi:MAG: tRNA (N6-isopentenyl adenosine(37)-C2)-methylthiotransferase MiaB [Pseudomonadales bacterium]|nr:tRNA (N6-isopentenyl adenosine(37)-C2)-methylthiotransferase MiaB [Pseudomonadales bacterium]
MSKKVYIETQGCQMNEYDSSRMADLLGESHGMVRTNNPEEADVLLMNTCSIREKAQEKVFSELGRWRKIKEKRPEVVIGVGGCVASQEGDTIRKRASYVDMVFGPQTLHRLPKMLDEKQHNKISIVDISFPDIEKFDFLPEPKVEGYKAYVSIMEGCSKYCSFCVVPYTRGEEVSRPFDDVIAEIVHLASQGIREVTLLGQNVNGYRGTYHDGEVCTFAELLKQIHEIDGIGRIRFTTSHPLEFNDDLIEAYTQLPKLVSHVHLPIQSGSDAVLAAMKRNHSADDYLQRIRKLKTARPDIHISSDFIIGFPNESDEDFIATMNVIADVDYDHSYSFIYSKRPGTPASELADSIDEAIKKQRLKLLQTRIKQNSERKTRAMQGTTQRVLFEKISDKDSQYMIGTAENTRLVLAPANAALLGHFADVVIDEIVSINTVRGQKIAWSEI